MSDAIDSVTAFGCRLRAEGLVLEPARLLDFARALAIASPARAYWIGRATLISRHADTPAYDRAFQAHFGGGREPEEETIIPAPEPPHPEIAPGGTGDRDETLEGSVAAASPIELLRYKRFDECTDEELAQSARLVRDISWNLPMRRRQRRHAARRGELDVQQTLRAALRTGGETLILRQRERRITRRRLVLVLDISNSMAPYSRALLVLAHAALSADPNWEAFCFATELTYMTDALRAANPDAALRAAASSVGGWGGGTRIAASLRRLLREQAHTRLLRGAIVVICSDGLEVGDADLLGEQMAHLGRLAHQVVWLNPLKGLEGYEPLARGMRAALPHVDVFASGDNLASLETLAQRFTGVSVRHLGRG